MQAVTSGRHAPSTRNPEPAFPWFDPWKMRVVLLAVKDGAEKAVEAKKDRQEGFPTRETALIGAARVHHVVPELGLRGLIVLPIIRDISGVDVVVAKSNGGWHVNLQVKTSRSKVTFWPIGKMYRDWVGSNNFGSSRITVGHLRHLGPAEARTPR